MPSRLGEPFRVDGVGLGGVVGQVEDAPTEVQSSRHAQSVAGRVRSPRHARSTDNPVIASDSLSSFVKAVSVAQQMICICHAIAIDSYETLSSGNVHPRAKERHE